MQRRLVFASVLFGEWCGREDRSCIDCPACYRSTHLFTAGHETWNRAATSLIGKPSSTTRRASFRRWRGVRAAFGRVMSSLRDGKGPAESGWPHRVASAVQLVCDAADRMTLARSRGRLHIGQCPVGRSMMSTCCSLPRAAGGTSSGGAVCAMRCDGSPCHASSGPTSPRCPVAATPSRRSESPQRTPARCTAGASDCLVQPLRSTAA